MLKANSYFIFKPDYIATYISTFLKTEFKMITYKMPFKNVCFT